MPGLRFLEGGIGNLESADVGDVFPLGELAVDVLPGQRLVGGVLVDDRLGAFVVGLGRGGRPPIAQVTDGVVLPALVVETMSHFVADDRADAAIVHRVVGLALKKGGWRMPAGKTISFRFG